MCFRACAPALIGGGGASSTTILLLPPRFDWRRSLTKTPGSRPRAGHRFPSRRSSMRFGCLVACVSFRPARFATGICLVTIVLPASAALAGPAPSAGIPRLMAVDYVSKLPPGVAPSASEKVYLASLHEPRTSTGTLHLHGGAWTPIEKSTANAMLGMRLGANMGDHVLFGALTGWTYHTASLYD